MDYLFIVLGIGIVYWIAWFAYRVGQDSMARKYASEVATCRARIRRLQRDLDQAYELNRMRRGGDAA